MKDTSRSSVPVITSGQFKKQFYGLAGDTTIDNNLTFVAYSPADRAQIDVFFIYSLTPKRKEGMYRESCSIRDLTCCRDCQLFMEVIFSIFYFLIALYGFRFHPV